jgi:tetratricopeptide (TPR) repeat protein
MRILVVFLFLLPALLRAQSLQKAKALYNGGKPAEAVKLLEPVDDESKDYAEAQYYLGRIAFDKKEYDDAADYFEEATEADDKKASYFEFLGNTYGMIARDANVVRQGFLAPKMKDAWEKAVALDAKNIGARQSLIEFYTQAPGFMGGSMEKAKETARQIIKLNAALGHRAMGNLFVREKNIAAAEKEFLEMAKADAALTTVLTNFYIMHQQYDKAFVIFDEQLKKNPGDMSVIYQVGKTCALSGKQLERGEQSLKQYLTYKPKENEPSHAGANMRLAQIHEKRGNKEEAKKLYQTAFKLDKTMKEAEEGLARVSK